VNPAGAGLVTWEDLTIREKNRRFVFATQIPKFCRISRNSAPTGHTGVEADTQRCASATAPLTKESAGKTTAKVPGRPTLKNIVGKTIHASKCNFKLKQTMSSHAAQRQQLRNQQGRPRRVPELRIAGLCGTAMACGFSKARC